MLANNALIADFRTRLSEYPFALQVPHYAELRKHLAASSAGASILANNALIADFRTSEARRTIAIRVL